VIGEDVLPVELGVVHLELGLDQVSHWGRKVAEIPNHGDSRLAPSKPFSASAESDYAPFLGAGVPILFFSDTTGGCYHTPGDDLATGPRGQGAPHRVDRVPAGRRTRQRRLENRLHVGPAAPHLYRCRYAEDRVRARALHAAASGLTPAEIAQAEGWVAELDAIVSAGADAFDASDGVAVGLTALDAISLLTSLPCQAN